MQVLLNASTVPLCVSSLGVLFLPHHHFLTLAAAGRMTVIYFAPSLSPLSFFLSLAVSLSHLSLTPTNPFSPLHTLHLNRKVYAACCRFAIIVVVFVVIITSMSLDWS